MSQPSAPRLFIGTSGWHYPHWRGTFYPPDLRPSQWLAYYAGFLASAEINNIFYRLPRTPAITQWLSQTPRDFLFAVKAWRVLTHMHRLHDCAQPLAKFLRAVEPLGPKLGPLLFQLPPRWRCNADRLADFIGLLPPGRRCVFEFRDPSWHVPEVFDLLRRHNAAFCIYELRGFLSPLEVTADFAYIRLHGPGGAYEGSYHPNTLRAWLRRIDAMHCDAYVYFDNDQAGYAVHNAIRLRDMDAARRGRVSG